MTMSPYLKSLLQAKAKAEPTFTKKEIQAIKTSHNRAEKSLGLEHDPLKDIDFKVTYKQIDLAQFDKSQRAAYEAMIDPMIKICLIVGTAGTGKTTITKEALRAKLNQNPKLRVSISAFTGQSVSMLAKNMPPEYKQYCRTIHAMLGYAPFRVDGVIAGWQPTFTENNPLPFDLIILDEIGMCDAVLWNQIMRALPPTCEVILLGDINQLPPIMGHSPLGFLINEIPTYELKTIHRQAQGSLIITNAHRIANGQKPVQGKNYVMINLNDFDKPELKHDLPINAYTKILEIVTKLYTQGIYNPLTDTIITGYNDGYLGKDYLNKDLLRLVNPLKESNLTHYGKKVYLNSPITIATGKTKMTLQIGQKVMLTENNMTMGLTNGMQGVITSIVRNPAYNGSHFEEELKKAEVIESGFDFDFSDIHTHKSEDKVESLRQASHITTVQFHYRDNAVEFKTSQDYTNLTTSYCVTCHKMQGGQSPLTIVICHSAQHLMNYNEYLFTATTRATERVVLIYNTRGLNSCLKNRKIKGTTLEQKANFLKNYANEKKKSNSTTEMPIVPKIISI